MRGDHEHVLGRDHHVLGEGAGPGDADTGVVVAELAPATLAVAAMSARDVALAGNSLADLQSDDIGAHLFDLTHELVPDHHRHGNGRLGPRVPVEDVQIGTADRGLAHPDQHVAVTRDRLGHILEPEPGFLLGLHQCFHVINPIARPTRTNAPIAMSMSASLCAADICVRIRALPCGTTGNENAIT